MEQSSEAAAQALAFIEQSREKLAAASETPPARHVAFALLMGVLVASPMLPFSLRVAALVGIFAATLWIIRWDRRRMGMFINGYRAGKTRWVTVALLLVILPLHVASIWLSLAPATWWAPLPLGFVAVVLAYGGSLWWCRVFRRELLGIGA